MTIRRTARARRLILKVDPCTGAALVVAPPHVTEDALWRFVSRNRDWLQSRVAAIPAPLPFVDGALVPYVGVDHHIRHRPAQARPVIRADAEFRIGGGAEHLGRRLVDYLRSEAARELSGRACDKALMLNRRPARVTVRDQRSRWGSCTAGGHLSFNWRLILAPEPVVDYVVAHEVAHLQELNHSDRFWRLVATLTPTLDEGRDWLKAHGAQLRRYGLAPPAIAAESDVCTPEPAAMAATRLSRGETKPE